MEAVGSPIWGPLLPRLREAADFIIGTDVDPYAWSLYRVDCGGTGIRRVAPSGLDGFDMTGHVTQEFLEGQEYSIDAFCGMDGTPVCVVVRERLAVESGVSVRGRIVTHPEIEREARRALAATGFVGPVNMQCFLTGKGVFFIEINPRIAGGLSLSMAATGNWFAWARDMLFKGAVIPPCRVRTGLVMMRHHEDVIIHEDERIGRTN